MIKKITSNELTLEYVFERKSVKNINIRIRRDGSVYVSAPANAPFSVVEQFVASKMSLIHASFEQIRQKNFCFCDGAKVFHLGKLYFVKIIPSGKGKVVIDGNFLCVYSKNNAISVFDKWEKERASEIITELCKKMFPLFQNFCPVFPLLHFRKMVSKWGVCRPVQKKITFSTMLVRAPLQCIEYVICHEFVHFLHPDHSANFYNALSVIMPDWKTRKKQLSDYTISHN